jgi:hypothetical protein
MHQDELSLVQRYKALAENYNSRPIVARRGSLVTLLKFLQHEDREVRFVAATTIALLADHPENPEVICCQEGLVQALFDRYKCSELEDPEIRQVIAGIFQCLRPVLDRDENAARGGAVHGKAGDGAADESAATATALLDLDENRGNFAENESVRTVKNRPTRIRQQSNVVYKSIVLNLPCLATSQEFQDLAELLQTTKGVISYTVKHNEGDEAGAAGGAGGNGAELTVFASTPTAVLIKLLGDQGFAADLVSETVVENAAQRGGAGGNGAADGRRPMYRSGLGGAGAPGLSSFYHSLVLHGSHNNSLSERLRKQKEERERKAASELSSITGFIGKLTKGWW